MAGNSPGRPSRTTKSPSAPSDQQDQLTPSEKIDARIASLSGWKGKKLAEIRRLIHEADPHVVEEWKWRGTPVWEHDGIIAFGDAFKEKVKFTFHQGAHLPDPHNVFNAGLGGNKWRAIDLYEGDDLDEAAFKQLVHEAVAYNTNR
jgi:hypothetical protein